MDAHFEEAHCECGEMLLDGLFAGVVRVKCGGCRRRLWIVGDGQQVRVSMLDRPPRRVVASDDN